MKQSVRFLNLTIPGKLRVEVRITVDDRGSEYVSDFNGNKSASISLMPIIGVSITRPSEIDENGKRVRAPWNPNDSLGMTKYNLPILVEELNGIQEDLKTIDLYTYQGKRLELNEEVAAKIRRVFMIGNTTLELSAVVIVQPEDDKRVEGIKMKFNNEQSSVLLTLNELSSLSFTLQNMDVDSLAMLMYLNYITKPEKPTLFDSSTLSPKVDILPKEE